MLGENMKVIDIIQKISDPQKTPQYHKNLLKSSLRTLNWLKTKNTPIILVKTNKRHHDIFSTLLVELKIRKL